MDSETLQMVDRMRLEAGSCDCLGCRELRIWADQIVEQQPNTFEEIPDGELYLYEDCDCQGCRYSRYVLFLGEG